MNENLPIGILPELHPDVFPEVMVRSNDDWSDFARNLMDAGIFDASDVPDYVEDTRQVIFHGLTAWCTRHIKETDYISLGFMLKTVTEAYNEFSVSFPKINCPNRSTYCCCRQDTSVVMSNQ